MSLQLEIQLTKVNFSYRLLLCLILPKFYYEESLWELKLSGITEFLLELSDSHFSCIIFNNQRKSSRVSPRFDSKTYIFMNTYNYSTCSKTINLIPSNDFTLRYRQNTSWSIIHCYMDSVSQLSSIILSFIQKMFSEMLMFHDLDDVIQVM